MAQNVARGQTLYTQLGCNTSNCHGANPAENLRNVLNGAGSAATIEYAAIVRSEMNPLLTSFQSDEIGRRRPRRVSGDDHAGAAAAAASAADVAGRRILPCGLRPLFRHQPGCRDRGARQRNRSSAGRAPGARSTPTHRATASSAPSAGSSPSPSRRRAPTSTRRSPSNATDSRAARDWQYEGEAFFVDLPDANGVCAGTASQVYRLYNSGLGGAPNHRYATDPAVRAEMLAKGWVSEGLGPLGVIFCVPS